MAANEPVVFSIPGALIILALMFAGVCFIVGAKRLGGRIVFLTIAIAFATPFLTPFVAGQLGVLPSWVVAAGAVLLGLLVLQGLIGLVFGHHVAAHVIGELLTRFILIVGAAGLRPLRWLRRTLRDFGDRGSDGG